MALLVATAHLGGTLKDIPAELSGHAVAAVRLFFVLSGFYMAMVLQQGRYARPLDFYASRLLKLLPMYWIVSATTFAVAATVDQFSLLVDPLPVWHRLDLATLPASTIAYIFTSLVTLIGADTWTWLGFNPVSGAWSIAPGYGPGATGTLALAAVPQAWTLGLEICFYALAPFFVRMRTVWLLVMIIGSVALRLGFDPGSPYDRSLFIFELPLFLAGMIAFRVIPALTWIATRLGPIDAALGALSYPAYISHFLVFGLLYQTSVFALPWPLALPLALGCVIALSVALDLLVARPVDAMRVRFGARSRLPEATARNTTPRSHRWQPRLRRP